MKHSILMSNKLFAPQPNEGWADKPKEAASFKAGFDDRLKSITASMNDGQTQDRSIVSFHALQEEVHQLPDSADKATFQERLDAVRKNSKFAEVFEKHEAALKAKQQPVATAEQQSLSQAKAETRVAATWLQNLFNAGASLFNPKPTEPATKQEASFQLDNQPTPGGMLDNPNAGPLGNVGDLNTSLNIETSLGADSLPTLDTQRKQAANEAAAASLNTSLKSVDLTDEKAAFASMAKDLEPSSMVDRAQQQNDGFLNINTEIPAMQAEASLLDSPEKIDAVSNALLKESEALLKAQIPEAITSIEKEMPEIAEKAREVITVNGQKMQRWEYSVRYILEQATDAMKNITEKTSANYERAVFNRIAEFLPVLNFRLKELAVANYKDNPAAMLFHEKLRSYWSTNAAGRLQIAAAAATNTIAPTT